MFVYHNKNNFFTKINLGSVCQGLKQKWFFPKKNKSDFDIEWFIDYFLSKFIKIRIYSAFIYRNKNTFFCLKNNLAWLDATI